MIADAAAVRLVDQLVELGRGPERGLDRAGVAEMVEVGVAGRDRVVRVVAREPLRVIDADALAASGAS